MEFDRTAATAPLFKYLAPSDSADEKMVSQEGIEPSTRRLRVQSVLENRRNPNDFAGQVCRMRQRAATGPRRNRESSRWLRGLQNTSLSRQTFGA